MSFPELVTWILGSCTILGGIAAILYFRERRDKRPTTRQKLIRLGQKLGYSDELLSVPDGSLEALVKRPPLWEYRFLHCLLGKQVETRRRLKLELRYGAPLPSGSVLDESSANTWLLSRFAAARRMAGELEALLHEAVPDALGPPGTDGDPVKLLHTALALGRLYEKALQWGLDFNRVSPPRSHERLFSLMPASANTFVDAIEETRDKLSLFIEDFERSPPAEGEHRIVELQVTLAASIPPEVFEEIERIGNSFPDD